MSEFPANAVPFGREEDAEAGLVGKVLLNVERSLISVAKAATLPASALQRAWITMFPETGISFVEHSNLSK